MQRRKLLQLAAVALVATRAARAATYPQAGRAVRLVVPFPPGGGADVVARRIAPLLAERLGVAVVVDNKPGANQVIGLQDVLQAPADAHTLFVGAEGILTTLPHQVAKLPYDPWKDVRAVGTLMRTPLVLACHPSVPARNVAELVRHVRANPGRLSYASWGTPLSAAYFEILKKRFGLSLLHVPYKGIAQVHPDLLENRVQLVLEVTLQGIQYIRSGRITALAATGESRMATLPDVPTFAEQGIPGFEYNGSLGVFASSAVPDEAVRTLNRHLRDIVAQPDVVRFLEQANYQPYAATPDDYARTLRAGSDYWAPVLRELNLRLD